MRFTDKRRIDPDTGQVRTSKPVEGELVDVPESSVPGTGDSEPTAGADDGIGEDGEPDPVRAELLERTADLQRISAEYANYRRRVERDRQAVINGAKASVVDSLLGVLDDVERARSHGDLEGPFKAVGEKLVGALHSQGLTPFGAEGDVFDPALHEAVSHEGSGGEPVVSMVMRPGYRFGERLLRPAVVAVAETPANSVPDGAQAETAQSETAAE